MWTARREQAPRPRRSFGVSATVQKIDCAQTTEVRELGVGEVDRATKVPCASVVHGFGCL